ncbi:MAG: bifunctional DNA-formamidopyrimidine glycosylase/DNA-(apurinic or apyrimidinic site) lyase [Candidatus Cloacimonetes bacterium HGW-Cloacimonetes-1]|jgi:formamidopyrimidine-DNA glycosylase|nr:MAG: bifunctional DNA-formamidopyrimidine glycosylase/DNA-(apurinic or apyrimidinic site) lyase [Candidatus Cloacimonetes bacterium HGW-Cloacimonetes-1]
MPELPEVQTVINGLQDTLKNGVITSIECNYPGTVIYDPELGDEPFPSAVKAYERRGKYIIIHLENAHSIIVHLRMTGKLVWSTVGEETSKHQRACILVGDHHKIPFIDPRTFGKITICLTANVGSYVTKLGAEPLSPEFTADYLLQKLSRKKSPIKTALLDQSTVAGLGNIYVCEILYRAKIRPDRDSAGIRLPKLREVVKHTKAVLAEALANNGTSISDFRRIDDKTGEFQNFLRVYQKKSCPLDHPIENLRIAGRSSFYCPVCQK